MEKQYSVVVSDDPHVSRRFFEIHVQMTGCKLTASLSSAEQAVPQMHQQGDRRAAAHLPANC